jgi:hypothetical protein
MEPFQAHSETLQALKKPETFFELADPEDPAAGVVYLGPDDDATEALVKEVFKALVRVSFGKDFRLPIRSPSSREGRLADEAKPAAELSLTRRATPFSPPPPPPPPTAPHSRRLEYKGHSLTKGDFNGDGLPDVAVGSYGTGVPGKQMCGSIAVTYGHSGGNYSTSVVQVSIIPELSELD